MLTLCSFVLNGFDRNCSVTPQAQYSPLLLAAGRKDAPDPEMIQILLTAGADINFKCMYHTTGLHEAVEARTYTGNAKNISPALGQCLLDYFK